MRLLTGNLGRCVIKVSAVKPDYRKVRAPAVVFHTQDAMQEAFRNGELNKDFVAVVRFQGPKANGMPELHKLTPALGVWRVGATRWHWSPMGECFAPLVKSL